MEASPDDTVMEGLEPARDDLDMQNTGKAPSEVGAQEPAQKKEGFKVKKKLQVEMGTAQVMKFLLRKKKNLWTLCKNGDYEAVKYLLEEGGVDINMKDHSHKDWTPLHYACRYGHFEIVQLLLDKGADQHLKATNGFTALPIACYYNYVRIANLLLKNGAYCNQIIDEKPPKNFTPIMLVSSDPGEEDVEPLARALLKYGADLEIPDMRGWTPIMNAADLERVNLVKLYLEYGADPNRKADRDWTALMSAAKRDAGEIARLLIENGADMEAKMTPDPKTGKGIQDPALHVASYMGGANVVKELIEHGAEVNKPNADGLTPLMIATNQGQLKAVEALLKSEAVDIDLPHEVTGLSALFIAAKKGYLDTFECLLQHGARDEVNSVSVSEVASFFKKKDQIIARLKKYKSIKQTELSTPEIDTQIEAAVETTESGDTKTVPQSGSVTTEPQSTESVTAEPQRLQSTENVTESRSTASVTATKAVTMESPSVSEGVMTAPAPVQDVVSVKTVQDTTEVKPEEADVPDDQSPDTSSLYGDGEDSPSEQKKDQDKGSKSKQQPSLSREEFLKQLLKRSDMIWSSYQNRMSSFTNENEFSGKGVKPVQQPQQEQKIILYNV